MFQEFHSSYLTSSPVSHATFVRLQKFHFSCLFTDQGRTELFSVLKHSTLPVLFTDQKRTVLLSGFHHIQARLFARSCGQGGAHCAPSENHILLALTSCWLIFLKACPRLDHMTHFGFHGNQVKCVFKVAQTSLFYKNL